MDPRMRQILLLLLQMTLESPTEEDPLDQPAPDAPRPHPPGSLGHNLEQLSSPRQKYTWPFNPQVTDFGPA